MSVETIRADMQAHLDKPRLGNYVAVSVATLQAWEAELDIIEAEQNDGGQTKRR